MIITKGLEIVRYNDNQGAGTMGEAGKIENSRPSLKHVSFLRCFSNYVHDYFNSSRIDKGGGVGITVERVGKI